MICIECMREHIHVSRVVVPRMPFSACLADGTLRSLSLCPLHILILTLAPSCPLHARSRMTVRSPMWRISW